ncbi:MULTISPECIES: molybdopterin converting factor subunit 1 [Bartonella]|uniref:Molybdopterin synthase subunit MoaD n=1 Tax=Bartonella choladocola TaxID=2750995 RepID=A0A1U9MGB9_9HYPH|nr:MULTISPECIES: molybdopterin converting factor subunit 1 [Bartonella]AQT47017.1 molybdopterin synthase subunit MoaD [Bartonella choladocola]MBH9975185.1 molybdopterin converting factor subunit 1 [Bartonella choladocola]MBI0014791.1 molybdopterin converting factor subunit 1 [Bartonella sp. B10834G3]MBI0140368.1 molybdopterin converting factor subunit 1 [Bartonella choladocola]
MKLQYFAWVRERIGRGEETLELPQNVKTVDDLLSYLKTLGENYAFALENPELIRVAIDEEHVDHDSLIGNSHEIALFPPMTGG